MIHPSIYCSQAVETNPTMDAKAIAEAETQPAAP